MSALKPGKRVGDSLDAWSFRQIRAFNHDHGQRERPRCVKLGVRSREASLKRGSRGTAALSTREAVLRRGCRLRSRPHRERHEATHAAEPEVSSAIEGGKIPGRAPNHYSRLAGSVDAMELYDLGDNVEIVRSLNPRRVMLQTSEARGISTAADYSRPSRCQEAFFPRRLPRSTWFISVPLAAGENTVARYSKLRRKIR